MKPLRACLLAMLLLLPSSAETALQLGGQAVRLEGQAVRVGSYTARLPPVRSLEASGDLDGDGHPELFVMFTPGDSEVQRFGWLEWTGKELVSVEQGYLCPLNQRPGTFKFSPTANSSYWVSDIQAVEKGRLKVHLYDGVTRERNLDTWLRLDPGPEFVVTE